MWCHHGGFIIDLLGIIGFEVRELILFEIVPGIRCPEQQRGIPLPPALAPLRFPVLIWTITGTKIFTA